MWHHTTLEYVHKTTISFTYLSSYRQVGRQKTCCKVLLRKRKDQLTSEASLESPIKRFRSPLASRLWDLKWNSKLNPGFFPASFTLWFQMLWQRGAAGGVAKGGTNCEQRCVRRAPMAGGAARDRRLRSAWRRRGTQRHSLSLRSRADLWQTFCLF